MQGLFQLLRWADLATRLKAIKNCHIKASLMALHCVDTCHCFDLAEKKNLSYANSWTAMLLKEAWLSNINPINKSIEL